MLLDKKKNIDDRVKFEYEGNGDNDDDDIERAILNMCMFGT